MPTIRMATLSDASALANLAEQTFRDTFADTNTAQDMDLHCQNTYSQAIQLSEINNPDIVTLVAEDNSQLVAYSQVRWAEVEPCVSGSTPGEIHRLYVDRDWHGKGLAPALMDACLQALKVHGSDVVWLGVWEHNPRAIAFYRKFGFAEVGDHVFPVGNDPQRDIIMMRSLG
jgi:ribosomal protein S18 acetylase RimI-like enzyme